MLRGVDDESRPSCASGCVQHIMLQIKVCFSPLLSAVCGDDLPGDGGRVPWYHQCGDISFWEPCAADRGTLQLFCALHKEILQTHRSFFPKLLIRRECNC